jgi:hypothetical protein
MQTSGVTGIFSRILAAPSPPFAVLVTVVLPSVGISPFRYSLPADGRQEWVRGLLTRIDGL